MRPCNRGCVPRYPHRFADVCLDHNIHPESIPDSAPGQCLHDAHDPGRCPLSLNTRRRYMPKLGQLQATALRLVIGGQLRQCAAALERGLRRPKPDPGPGHEHQLELEG